VKDFKLCLASLVWFIKEVTLMVAQGKEFRVKIVGWRESRSLNQNAFQHVIYHELSKYLMSKGRTDWDSKKVKFEMKNNFLGWVETECTDVITGDITFKEVLKETSKLDVGESFHYTTQLLDFSQSIGCTIKIPENSDYFHLQAKQNS